MRIIDLYNQIVDGKIHLHNGLCVEIQNELSNDNREEFAFLFRPNDDERKRFFKKKHFSTAYWGSDSDDFDEMITDFSPTRQNMLLLFAAINEEL